MAHRKQRQAQLGLESLEQRVVPAGQSQISAHVVGGTLMIIGSNAGKGDQIRVTETSPGPTKIFVKDGLTGKVFTFDRSAVKDIMFSGRNGNDYFVNDTGVRCEAFGDAGNDTLWGG